jgi:hypothetical protein
MQERGNVSNPGVSETRPFLKRQNRQPCGRCRNAGNPGTSTLPRCGNAEMPATPALPRFRNLGDAGVSEIPAGNKREVPSATSGVRRAGLIISMRAVSHADGPDGSFHTRPDPQVGERLFRRVSAIQCDGPENDLKKVLTWSRGGGGQIATHHLHPFVLLVASFVLSLGTFVLSLGEGS